MFIKFLFRYSLNFILFFQQIHCLIKNLIHFPFLYLISLLWITFLLMFRQKFLNLSKIMKSMRIVNRYLRWLMNLMKILFQKMMNFPHLSLQLFNQISPFLIPMINSNYIQKEWPISFSKGNLIGIAYIIYLLFLMKFQIFISKRPFI